VGVRVEFFMKLEEAGEFLDGSFMIIHPNINEAIIEAGIATLVAHNQQGGGLSTSFIAPGSLSSRDGSDQPVGELTVRLFASLFKRGGHVGHHRFTGEEVALRGIVIARLVTGPGSAAFAGETGGAALSIDHTDLSQRARGIDSNELFKDGLGRFSDGHQLQAFRAIGGVGVRLGGDRAHTGLRPRHYGADAKKFALHRDSEIAGGWIESNDGVRGHGTVGGL